MPKPHKGEDKKDFISRCIPIVIEDGTAKDQKQAVAICNSIWKGAKMFVKNISMDDLLLVQGGAIKALGNGKVGGHLVMFGDEEKLDLENDFFTSGTDFGLDVSKSTAVYFNHGYDPVLKRRRLGKGALEQDDVGIWIEAQLELRDEYEQAIYSLVEAEKLGWSSGTAPNLVERVEKGTGNWIKSWPLGLDASLTPIPAEPRITAIPIKSYSCDFDLKSFMGETGEVEPNAGEAFEITDPSTWTGEVWAEMLKIYVEVIKEKRRRLK